MFLSGERRKSPLISLRRHHIQMPVQHQPIAFLRLRTRYPQHHVGSFVRRLKQFRLIPRVAQLRHHILGARPFPRATAITVITRIYPHQLPAQCGHVFTIRAVGNEFAHSDYATGIMTTHSHVASPPQKTGGITHSAGPVAALWTAAAACRGFMPLVEGAALAEAAHSLGPSPLVLEIGTYGARSTLFLATGVLTATTTPWRVGQVITLDHHRGSEEHQPGWDYHDPTLVDDTGQVETLPMARHVIRDADAEHLVTMIVATSEATHRWWRTPVDAVFLDGSHTEANAFADYHRWAPWVRPGGLLLIHDVFEDPADGGQAPRLVRDAALASGRFAPHTVTGSLHALRALAQ